MLPEYISWQVSFCLSPPHVLNWNVIFSVPPFTMSVNIFDSGTIKKKTCQKVQGDVRSKRAIKLLIVE